MIARLGALVLCLGLLLSCGDDDPAPAAESPTASPSPTERPSEQPSEQPTKKPSPKPSRTPVAPGTRVVVDDSEFGPMLFDDTGQAIYLFDVESTSTPRCYDECAEAWPPVLTEGEPVAGRGADAGLLGIVKRSDGTLQVTYGDHPLYFYAHEAKGEVLCHDVFLNGGNWYVVQPDGSAAPPG